MNFILLAINFLTSLFFIQVIFTFARHKNKPFVLQMKNRYIDLIQQSYDFPQEGFEVIDDSLHFNGINLMDVIKQYGTPLKITYLPKIAHKFKKPNDFLKLLWQKLTIKEVITTVIAQKVRTFSS